MKGGLWKGTFSKASSIGLKDRLRRKAGAERRVAHATLMVK